MYSCRNSIPYPYLCTYTCIYACILGWWQGTPLNGSESQLWVQMLALSYTDCESWNKFLLWASVALSVNVFSSHDYSDTSMSFKNTEKTIVVVQLLSCVQLFVNPWTAACQASLSYTISQSLLKLMSIESVMPQLSHPLSPPSCHILSLSQHQGLYQSVGSSN